MHFQHQMKFTKFIAIAAQLSHISRTYTFRTLHSHSYPAQNLYTCPKELSSFIVPSLPIYDISRTSTMAEISSSFERSMKAAVIHEAGGPENFIIEDRPVPKPVIDSHPP